MLLLTADQTISFNVVTMVSNIIFILMSIISAGNATFFCKWPEISGILRCDESCKSLGKKCIPTFRPGCQCIPSHRRNQNEKCVPKADCCNKLNEVYAPFGVDLTCEGLEKTISKQFEGCFCKIGFVRDASKNCIDKKDCLPKCTRQNEEAKKSGCDKKCNGEDYENCNGKAGCFCKSGFKRFNGDCVLAVNCPKPACGKNECYQQSGCDQNCDGSNYKNCNGKSGCFCMKGYKRDGINCVPKDECPAPPECGENECYQQSGCDQNCDGSNYKNCNGKSGCFCMKGYKRDGIKCVPKDECPAPPECGENECYQQSGCDYNCKNVELGECPGKAKCYCIKGYKRENGKCIPTEKCRSSCTSRG